MQQSRTYNTVRNTIYALVSQGIYTLASFVCRSVFIYSLGRTYLGLSGLFSDILTLLSLAELGVGTAIIYSMYKPVAENDERQISALMNFYCRAYMWTAVVITVVGLCLTPFLNFFISGMPDIPELPWIYVLYLLNTSLGYFLAHKRSILITSQNLYIASIIYSITVIVQNVLQIMVLWFWHSFIIYLVLQIITTVGNNILVSIYVDKKYPYLKNYRNVKLGSAARRKIIINIKAMFVTRLSSAVVTSTDNLLISKFISTILLGYYSNYALFVSIIRTIFTKVFESITGSVGNLTAIASPKKSKDVFHRLFFANFWLITFCSICLDVLVNPFIQMWIGKSYLLSEEVVFFVCVNMYMRLIRNTQLVFIDTCGMFRNVQWKCAAEAVINLAASLIFLIPLKMGIFGVLLGTLLSNLATSFWFEPIVIYRRKFNASPLEYFVRYAVYTTVAIVVGALTKWICGMIRTGMPFLNIIIMGLICCLLPNGILYCIFHKTTECRYYKEMLQNRLGRIVEHS